MRAVGRKYRLLKSSTLQSLERGRKTEIDFLNGHVVEKANSVGVDVPLNKALVRMIKELEQGDRKIEKRNMSEFLSVMG